MNASQDLEKLSTIHSLFTAASGGDNYNAEQISAALRYAQDRPGLGLKREERPFDVEVRKLIDLHLESQSQHHGVAVWDMRDRPYDPLWIRYHIVSQLKQIAGYLDATLIVVGLKEAICPQGRYFTKSKKERYQQAVSYVEELALCYKTHSTKLNILFV
ncbi:MAG: hypothetical protein MK080_07030 [Opitutales bacterium]|nr:hypothetical protein [Opitutales bacterium]NRA26350.1 hypothetical protein [Opitutales bacterium]